MTNSFPRIAHAVPAVRSYYAELDSVPGWFDRLDFRLFCELAQWQSDRDITGDTLEIGAYRGKSAILLGLLCGKDENLIVCDLFEALEQAPQDRVENERWYGQGALRAHFEAEYLKRHHALPIVLPVASSELTRVDIPSSLRFIHIDGSHLFDAVRLDLSLAHQLSSDGAIVALDDYARAHAPGVAPAVWDAHSRLGLRPFLQSEGKLYAVWGRCDEDLLSRIEHWAVAQSFVVSRQTILGGPLLSVTQPTDVPKRISRITYLATPPLFAAAARRLRSAVLATIWTQRRTRYPAPGSAKTIGPPR